MPKQLVGVDPHVRKIMTKLKVDYPNGQAVQIGDTCRKVLIHGIPGVGKTVLAKCVFNQLNHLYDACSYPEEIQASINRYDAVTMQNKLISHLHRGNAQNFDCVDHALLHIQSRFRKKKVLLLLDDVKDREQLEELVARLDWFGPGSTVIVTSRRHDVFQKVNGAESHVLRTMKEDNALTLFCKHAFEKDSPAEKFKKLATKIVDTTNRLPLALQNVGEYLFQITEKQVWKEKLKELEEAPHKSVQEAFFKNYTSLDENLI